MDQTTSQAWYSQQPSSRSRVTMHMPTFEMEPFPPLQSQTLRPSTPAQFVQRPAAQSRAIRQRRKDPSCDACRERKVKCDATDSLSCSECQSRGVRCHFTKDSSRRMSTARQVQDLERQLSHVLQENRQLRSILRQGTQTVIGNIAAPLSQPIGIARLRGSSTQQFPHSVLEAARQNLGRNSQDLFGPPRWSVSDASSSTDWQRNLDLPPQDITNRAIQNSSKAWYWRINLVNRERFISDCNSLYRTGSFALCRDAWIALFYAILCCGLADDPNLASISRQARQIAARIARQPHIADIDVCRAAVMLSQSYFESSLKFEARFWMSIAVLHATSLGLDLVDNSDDTSTRQEKNTVWYGVYSWDSLMSQDLLKPTFVSDPSDQSRHHQGDITGPDFLYLRTLVAVARIGDSINRCLQTMTMLPDVTMSIEKSIEAVEISLPHSLNSNAASSTEVETLWVTALLTNLRILLHRHKLKPRYPPSQRSTGLSQCATAARRTARTIERSISSTHPTSRDIYNDFFQPSVSEQLRNSSWTRALQTSTTAQFCLHLWRCILILSFSLDFHAARVCVQTARAIGHLRPINILAGRNVLFFLNELHQRIQLGVDISQLQRDEEMIVYVSADMQGDSYNAWVWSLDGGPVQARESHASISLAHTPSSTATDSRLQISSTTLGQGEADQNVTVPDEHVWSRVIASLQSIEQEYLLQQHQRRTRAQSLVHEGKQNIGQPTEQVSVVPDREYQQVQYEESSPRIWPKISPIEARQHDQPQEGHTTAQQLPLYVHGYPTRVPESGPNSSRPTSTAGAGASFAQRMSIASLLGEDRPGHHQDFPTTRP